MICLSFFQYQNYKNQNNFCPTKSKDIKINLIDLEKLLFFLSYRWVKWLSSAKFTILLNLVKRNIFSKSPEQANFCKELNSFFNIFAINIISSSRA